MSRSTLACLAGFLILVNPLAVAAENDAVERLARLGSALQSAEAWQARYQQEYIAAGMDFGELEEGVVIAAWPDHAFFRTGEPLRQLMGLDGRTVRLVDLEVQSCDQHHLSNEEWARIPLAAILDPSSAIEHFTVLEHGDRGIALVPREEGGVRRVEVMLGDDGLPIEVVVTDPQGAVNRLSFIEWRKSTPPVDGSWLPDAPAGIECVTDNR